MKNLLKISVLFLLISCVLIACKKVDFEVDDVPNCFKKMVRQCDPLPLFKIDKWEVDGKVFYEIDYDNCSDCFLELYDENCDYVCAPSGGIAGGGDGNCPTWNGTIIKTLVWKSE